LLGGRGIKNVYAADGRKLKSEAKQGSEYIKEGTKTYSGNLVFDINDELDYILFPEGRIVYNTDDSTFNYEYHLKDHLGSIRVAFVPTTGGTEVVQENNYYPFGAPINDLSWSPKSMNRYLREGKEYISDFDWNKYDFTGRTFDSWTLRALQVDPMATNYYGVSPYALWVNNPLRVIDPTGMFVDDPQQQPTTYDDLNFLQKMFYNIFSFMNAQGKAVNEMHGKKETTTEENVMASIEYITGTILLLQAHAEMTRSAGQISSSKKTTSVTKEASTASENMGIKSVATPADVTPKYLYHYTSKEVADNILKTGLITTEKRPLIYTTDIGNLSPLQAQIELALPANRTLPNNILRIDASELNPFMIRRIQGNLPGLGAGGGTEFIFNQSIPTNLIIIVK
jgi:RHS repeat-associated protein